jgi:nuclear protein localization family protein 4
MRLTTGDASGNITLEGYQVSVAAQAMVTAKIIEPSIEPSTILVREPTKDGTGPAYVPEVFYKYVNEYKVTVSKIAKPAFPVDYLLVTVCGFFFPLRSP